MAGGGCLYVEETGINALPIVGLLAFLVGVVLAYQGADQLKRFGAQIFTINLLGVGVLREIGGLITAIIVAGRSGSAFTACRNSPTAFSIPFRCVRDWAIA